MSDAVDFENPVEEVDRTPAMVAIRMKNDPHSVVVMEVDFLTGVGWSKFLIANGQTARLYAMDSRGLHTLYLDGVLSVEIKPKTNLMTVFKQRVNDPA